jgi:hypothetical protein
MTERRQWLVVAGLGAVLGVLAGIASERFRFEEVGNHIVRQLEDTGEWWGARAMAWERERQADPSPAATPQTEAPAATWLTRLQELDAALARRDVSGAEHAWRDAHGEARRTSSWRPLVDVGDAALRIGAAGGHRRPYVTKAREVYLAALTRARADRSPSAVLSVGEAFSALGDHEMARQCQMIADGLGGRRDSDADARARAFPSRVADANSEPRIEP